MGEMAELTINGVLDFNTGQSPTHGCADEWACS